MYTTIRSVFSYFVRGATMLIVELVDLCMDQFLLLPSPPPRATPGLMQRSALQFQIQVSDSDSYSDLNMKPGYKMSNCSVSFHGINVIRQGHPSSDYCAFDKAIVQFLADNVKPGKIAETTRPTREFLLRHVCLDLSTNLYFTVYRKIRVYFPNFRKTFISTL